MDKNLNKTQELSMEDLGKVSGGSGQLPPAELVAAKPPAQPLPIGQQHAPAFQVQSEPEYTGQPHTRGSFTN